MREIRTSGLMSCFNSMTSSLSDLNSKPLISFQFAFSGLAENSNDINMLAVLGTPSRQAARRNVERKRAKFQKLNHHLLSCRVPFD